MTRCLEKANKSRSRSIAFPAVGTGNLGYPKEYVAKLMYESIYKFSKNNPRLSLKQVNLVVYHEDEPTIQVIILWTFLLGAKCKTLKKGTAEDDNSYFFMQ